MLNDKILMDSKGERGREREGGEREREGERGREREREGEKGRERERERERKK